ncbi:MAG: ferritin-like domain-containing protein [Myxococcota bacterium]
MEKFMNEYRRNLGGFELIDFPDESQVAKIREKIDVPTPMAVRWNDWEYGSEVSELRALYEKGKDNQWNASHDIDWSIPLTNDEFIAGPELSLLGNITKLMGKDEATQKAAMFDEINWVLSQLLHGEQAALQICGQLTNLCPTTDEKFYAANQVYDEARHTEVFARLLGEKMGTIYPISPNLKILLDELLSVEGYTMKCLGMQTLFEGTAVGIMDQFRANSRNALITDVIRRVEQDESRHAAFGVLTMRRVVKRVSEAERQHMEDWAYSVLEALNANQQLDMLRVLGPKYGIEPDAVVGMAMSLPEWKEFNSQPFMHTVVPNLQRLGLLTERTESLWLERAMMVESRTANGQLAVRA